MAAMPGKCILNTVGTTYVFKNGTVTTSFLWRSNRRYHAGFCTQPHN